MKEPKILIHASPQRMEFVDTFLVPRLLKIGFKAEYVEVWEDKENKGCLTSYIESYEALPKTGDTWHLQDDVLPDRRFYKWARNLMYYQGIVNGFGNKWYYNKAMFGDAHNQHEMFYSFPCIRIPNELCHKWLKWFETAKVEVPEISSRLSENKYIDYFFKLFIGSNKDGIPIWNFEPCIVEHVDEYAGGSIVNYARQLPAKALSFQDDKALEELEEWFKVHNKDYEV